MKVGDMAIKQVNLRMRDELRAELEAQHLRTFPQHGIPHFGQWLVLEIEGKVASPARKKPAAKARKPVAVLPRVDGARR